MALELLKPGGKLILWKGQQAKAEAKEVAPEIWDRFVKIEEKVYDLPEGKGGRVMLFVRTR